MKRINAREKSIVTIASFREAIKKRRCLLAADAFYEWQKIGTKTKQAFAVGIVDGSQYGFAGLWESWRKENGGAAGDVYYHHDQPERSHGTAA